MFQTNSNIKSGYVSDKILILGMAMFHTNSNIKSGYVSDKILTETLILKMTMIQTKF